MNSIELVKGLQQLHHTEIKEVFGEVFSQMDQQSMDAVEETFLRSIGDYSDVLNKPVENTISYNRGFNDGAKTLE